MNKHFSKISFEKSKPASLYLDKKIAFYFTKSVFLQKKGGIALWFSLMDLSYS